MCPLHPRLKRKAKQLQHGSQCAALKPMRVAVPHPEMDGNAPYLSLKGGRKYTQIPIVIYANSEAVNSPSMR
jgi:hypothetical protein